MKFLKVLAIAFIVFVVAELCLYAIATTLDYLVPETCMEDEK